MQVRVFGGVRIGADADEVPIPNPRAGVLLTALVLARGAFVTSAELRSLMWPSDEPSSAVNQLQRLVGQLRRLFEPGLSPREAGVFIAGSSGGYRMDPSRIDSDLEECDAAVENARQLCERQQWDAATEHYLLALEIIKHPLLGDATWEGAGHPRFSAVARTRVAVAGEALTCAAQSARLEHAVTVVEQIAAAMPFDEGLQAALIQAMARAGRRRDAMNLYDRIRTGLVEELGVDPGPELRDAQQELLRIGEEGSHPAPASTGASDVRPAQLPSTLRVMTPRPEAQELLDQVARLGEAGAVAITSIGGMGGIGKTTLAVAWARSLAHRFPDGQLYVNLRGYDPAGQVMTPMDALSDLLRSLGAAPVKAEESRESRSARFRTLVSDRKLLLLLDNARDAEQVRPLLPNNPGCLVIVTSRNQLPSLVVREGAVPVRLDRMTDDQARDLLSRRLGVVRTGLQADAVDRIITAAAGLPLALTLVAARLALDPELALDAVADELTNPADQTPRLSSWSAGEQTDDLASVFDWSYELLDAETARFFRALSVHPGPDLSLRVLASITGLDLSATRQVASRLVGASLLERRGLDRFVIHDLLRDYAHSRLDALERRDTEARVVGHYVRSNRNAWGVYGRPPIGDLDAVADLPALQPETFGTPRDSTEWYLRERAVLPSMLHLAIARGWDRAAANIAIDWRPMNQVVDVDADTYPHAEAALDAAERTGDAVLVAELHRDLGPKVARLGDVEAGQRHLDAARLLYSQLGDRSGEAHALRNLANLPGIPHETRIDHLRAAIALVAPGEATQVVQMLQIDLALYLTVLADPGSAGRDACLEAEHLLTEAMPVIHEHGWTHMVPSAADTLAAVLMMLSRPQEALEIVSDARRYAEADPIDHVLLHLRVAEAALASGERPTAAQACRDYHALVANQDRISVDGMLARVAAFYPHEDPAGRISRVESALVGET